MPPFPAACHLFSFPSSPEPEATVRAQSLHREDRTGERGYLCMSTAPGRLLKRVYGVLTRGLACTRSPLSACLPARLPSRLPFLPQASSVPDAPVSWLFPNSPASGRGQPLPGPLPGHLFLRCHHGFLCLTQCQPSVRFPEPPLTSKPSAQIANPLSVLTF